MTSRKFWLFNPTSPSVTLKCQFYSNAYTYCHKITKPPSPYLRDVIYECSLIYQLGSLSPTNMGGKHKLGKNWNNNVQKGQIQTFIVTFCVLKNVMYIW